MERTEWLKKVRTMAEALYDHGAPAYWVEWGLGPDLMHREFIEKFLGRLSGPSNLLDAACGAGLYDGRLYQAGHHVLGIDQSGGVLARAREHYPQEQFPKLRYVKMGLQEMDFQAAFDGILCMDALEHICPEDWPVILTNFQRALKPGGFIYVTVDILNPDEDRQSYEMAKAMGLPVVFGEIVDELDAAYAEAMALEALDLNTLTFKRLDHTVYHYHPSMEQVRLWYDQTGLAIVEEGNDDEYVHVLAMKKA
jgi:2-polyprenyl-3-methyl-5-hydroxy-6-metoxy-1,4-benzoquinol methylase